MWGICALSRSGFCCVKRLFKRRRRGKLQTQQRWASFFVDSFRGGVISVVRHSFSFSFPIQVQDICLFCDFIYMYEWLLFCVSKRHSTLVAFNCLSRKQVSSFKGAEFKRVVANIYHARPLPSLNATVLTAVSRCLLMHSSHVSAVGVRSRINSIASLLSRWFS